MPVPSSIRKESDAVMRQTIRAFVYHQLMEGRDEEVKYFPGTLALALICLALGFVKVCQSLHSTKKVSCLLGDIYLESQIQVFIHRPGGDWLAK